MSSNLSNLGPSSPSCSRCVHGVCTPKGQSYSCQCNEGYQGQYCDRRQEPAACKGHRCGRGECRVSESGEPACHCQLGYTGPTCDTGMMGRNKMRGVAVFVTSSPSLICVSPSPLMSRADVPRRDGEGATEAPPPHENMHVHQQDSPHGLSAVLPGHGAPWRLLRRHQNQEEEGGFPLH